MSIHLKQWFAVLLTACILAGPAPYAGAAAAAAADGETRLGTGTLAEIDAYIRGQFRAAGFPGGAYAIVEGGRIAAAEGIGYADRRAERPVTPDTVYATASVTKPMTAAAILGLARQGAIDLDRTVVSYLPWFRYADKQASDRVTIRHLLTHSAGINRFAADGALYADIGTTRHSRIDAAKTLRTVPMNALPGARGQYCNTCFNLLGLVIEEVTGEPYEAYMARALFKPLGMASTAFRPDELPDADIAEESGFLFGFRVRSVPYWKAFGSSQAPEGGAYGSAADLARFAAAMLAEDGDPAIAASSDHAVRGVRAADLENAVYTESGFESRTANGERLLVKSGEGMGSSAEIVLLPDRKIGFVLLVGEANGEARSRIADGVVSLLQAREPGTAEGAPNFIRLLGYAALAITAASLLLVGLLVVCAARFVRQGRRVARRWPTLARLCLSGAAAAPIWYLLLAVRPTEAGFYGYPYDVAAALIGLAASATLWAAYSVMRLAAADRRRT